MNTMSLLGRIVTDVKCKEFVKDGNPRKAYSFTLAVSRHFRNADGKYESDYINCVYYTQKGFNYKKLDAIALTGSLRSVRFKGRDDKYVYMQYCLVSRYERPDIYGARKKNEEGKETDIAKEEEIDDIVLDDLTEYESNLLHILNF